jgi:hypothetical protein
MMEEADVKEEEEEEEEEEGCEMCRLGCVGGNGCRSG